MTDTPKPNGSDDVIDEALLETGPDRVTQVLKVAIFAVVILTLTGALYFLLAGVINPPAPRTALEAQLVVVREAVRLAPQSGEAWGDYIRTLTGLKLFREANKQSEEAHRMVTRGDQVVLIDLATFDLYMTQERYEDAYKLAVKLEKDEKVERDKVMKSMARKGVKVDPLLVAPEIAIDIRLAKARSSAKMKKWDEAIKALDEALTYDPQAADLLYLRGEAKRENGDAAAAKKDFEAALRLSPDYTPAKEALEKVGE